MKIKHVLIIFLIGFLVNIVGALFKVTHWPYGNAILTIGSTLEVISILLAIFKLIKNPKFKDFLNS